MQHDHGALALRQAFDQLAEAGVTGGRHRAADQEGQPLDEPLCSPVVVVAAVDRDASQPRLEGARVRQLTDALAGDHVHVLHHVVRLGGADERRAQPREARANRLEGRVEVSDRGRRQPDRVAHGPHLTDHRPLDAR